MVALHFYSTIYCPYCQSKPSKNFYWTNETGRCCTCSCIMTKTPIYVTLREYVHHPCEYIWPDPSTVDETKKDWIPEEVMHVRSTSSPPMTTVELCSWAQKQVREEWAHLVQSKMAFQKLTMVINVKKLLPGNCLILTKRKMKNNIKIVHIKKLLKEDNCAY